MTKTARLEDGRLIEYFPERIAEGSLKEVYLCKDNKCVLCFYKNRPQTDHCRFLRLKKILTDFNPTLGNNADYWKKLFCWPTAIIKKPQLGVMTPIYPSNYFFKSGPWQGLEKKSRWFISPKLRQYLPKKEQGTWNHYFQIAIRLARTVNRLHQAGLAHSDLSDNNILIDPTIGQMMMIDIDSIAVPPIFMPEVAGTPGYIAPEVLATAALPIHDLKKQFASIRTDQHALAVLIYEYLLNRHPLRGPKIHSSQSAEEDERLSLGEKALFIEHPNDTSNHPKEGIQVPVTALGSTLTELFYQAFITGLHAPNDRPSAYQWESRLLKTWQLLHPCPNPNCSHQWLVIIPEPKKIRCPFCQTPLKTPFPLLTIHSPKRHEQLVIYHGQGLFKWHIFDNIFFSPEADKTRQAYCVFYQRKWLLINQALTSLLSPNGHRVEINQAVELKTGTQIRFSQEPSGCTAEVTIISPYNCV